MRLSEDSGFKKKGVKVDSPVFVEDQLFATEMDDKVYSLARGWDGGQSARAPGTPGLVRAPTRWLIPWLFHTTEKEGAMRVTRGFVCVSQGGKKELRGDKTCK